MKTDYTLYKNRWYPSEWITANRLYPPIWIVISVILLPATIIGLLVPWLLINIGGWSVWAAFLLLIIISNAGPYLVCRLFSYPHNKKPA